MEESRATWDKRFKARHYSYRDFHAAATGATPVAYVFGTNAHAAVKWNWPRLGDFTGVLPCFAREVKVLCTEDAWIIFTSLNPLYLTLINQGYSAQQIAAGQTPLGAVPPYITEVPQYMPADDEITFYPTYAVSVTWYRSTVDGVIYVWAEGNVEGGE